MGLKFLDGKSWSDVTRDERFFCAHLYMLIEKKGVSDFAAHLNSKIIDIGLNPAANWEAAYEACFYRDYWHHNKKKGKLFSPKRTFDLCLFSDDTIVIIEAKSHEGFAKDQLESFKKDKKKVRDLTGVKNVILLALASSRYKPKDVTKNYFGGWLLWNDLGRHFRNDHILQRADDIYNLKAPSK